MFNISPSYTQYHLPSGFLSLTSVGIHHSLVALIQKRSFKNVRMFRCFRVLLLTFRFESFPLARFFFRRMILSCGIHIRSDEARVVHMNNGIRIYEEIGPN